MKIQTCKFIAATDLVPKKWSNWFWAQFSSNAPFSWGDNNRTLITAERFLSHCDTDVELPKNIKDKEYIEFSQRLQKLGQTYIDLEN